MARGRVDVVENSVAKSQVDIFRGSVGRTGLESESGVTIALFRNRKARRGNINPVNRSKAKRLAERSGRVARATAEIERLFAPKRRGNLCDHPARFIDPLCGEESAILSANLKPSVKRLVITLRVSVEVNLGLGHKFTRV